MNSIPRQGSIKFDLVNEESLTLKCIQVIFRHGARTPLKHLPGIDEVEYDEKILQPIDYMHFPSTTVTMDGSPVSSLPFEDNFNGIYFKGGAIAGQLTNVGRKQCFKLGLFLGDKYRKLFKDTFDSSLIWMRSSPLNRCIESLKSVLAGIYSENLSSLNNLPIKADLLNTKMYPLIFECSWYREALINMHKEMLEDLNYVSFTKKMKMNFNTMMESPLVDVALIYDHVRARKVHGLHVPEELEQLMPEIEKIATNLLHMNSGGKYNQVPNGLALSMGRLVNTLAKNFEAVANGTLNEPKPPSVFLFSGHDSTIAPILEILGCSNKKFPGFAANIVFELYEDMDKNHWVQVLYNGKPVILRHCCQTIVSLEEFSNVIRPFRINYEEFLNLCQATEA